MRKFSKSFIYKIVQSIALPLILVNIISILLLYSVSLLGNYQEIYSKLPFSESIEFQTAIFIIIILFEIISISVIVYRFMSSSTNIDLGIKDIIAKGENNEIEFKSSLRFDYIENKINKELEYTVAKTISAFLNTKGGVVLIGINDKGEIMGIKPDYETLKKKSPDGFLVYFTQIINYYLGKEAHRYLNISIEQLQEKEICLVQISKALEPIYVNHNDHKEFFIRTVSSVQPMDVQDSHNYIVKHWKQK